MTEHRAARLIPESADPLAALPLGPNHEGAEGRMGRRKSIPKRIRFEVFKRDSFKCQYCGKGAPEVILHVDHLHPVSKGGDADVLNLITACADCNAGKSDVLLADDSAIARQKQQLQELNERREQLEMMLEWREGLKAIESDGMDAIESAWSHATGGWYFTETGYQGVRKLVRKYGTQAVLEAIDVVADSYIVLDADGKGTADSIKHAFTKIGGVCRLNSLGEDERQIYYVRGICRKRYSWINERECLSLLRQAVSVGIDGEDLRLLAIEVNSYASFRSNLERWIEEAGKDDGPRP
jgi:hypothetical protein